jgi:acyl-CoA reductase-like NAD-dependent aldehyde dehydrogenase
MTVATGPDRPAGLTAARRSELDAVVAGLQQRAAEWLELPLGRKIRMAESALRGSLRVADRQVAAAVEAKGLPADSPLAGEDWFAGPYIQVRTLRLLIETLRRVERYGEVRVPAGLVRERPDGQVAVRVFPDDLLDGLLYRGFTADVWMEQAVTRHNLAEHVGLAQRRTDVSPGVALVLGAGNVASIPTLDAVYKLYAEGRATLLKLNPVNEYLGPLIEEAFAELIAAGFLQLTYGGAAVGSYLCHHDGVDEVHITGSERTHDLIVFGSGEEGAARKRDNRPLLRKPITSELGNVSPIIVVPGEWSDSDIQFHAENLATQMTQNGGFNCNAAKVIVTHRDWPQRRQLLGRLRKVLTRLPARPAYYPGAEERYERFIAAYPDAEPLGVRRPGVLPPTLAAGVHPGDAGPAFREESFCSFTVETALAGSDTDGFVRAAVDFCNERLHGTLNAGLVVQPRVRRALGGTIERAIEELRYGSVAVNHWPAMSYGLGSTPWGGTPGQPLNDVQSGRGFVHNTWLFDRPQKSVIEGPFRVVPKPAWFVTHTNAAAVGRELTRLEADRNPMRLPAILWNAFRGS